MARRVAMRCLWLAILSGVFGCANLREWAGRAAGLVLPTSAGESRVLGRASARGAPLGRAAVYLEAIDGEPAPKPPEPAVVREQLGGFEPDFLVVAVGQPIEFANRDKIFHGVFSYSPSNAFAERPFAPNESRSVSFRHPGVVRAYCPLHATQPAVILVVPGSLYTVPDPRGDFQIGEVPAGRYRLSLWTEKHGVSVRELTLGAGEVRRADLAPDQPR